MFVCLDVTAISVELIFENQIVLLLFKRALCSRGSLLQLRRCQRCLRTMWFASAIGEKNSTVCKCKQHTWHVYFCCCCRYANFPSVGSLKVFLISKKITRWAGQCFNCSTSPPPPLQAPGRWSLSSSSALSLFLPYCWSSWRRTTGEAAFLCVTWRHLHSEDSRHGNHPPTDFINFYFWIRAFAACHATEMRLQTTFHYFLLKVWYYLWYIGRAIFTAV